MLSLLTNTAAMSALQALRNNQSALEKTQRQVTSGLRVQDPSDDPVAWSIAQSGNADVASLAAVGNAMSASSAMLAPASAALTAVRGVLTKMLADVTAVQGGTMSASAAQDDFAVQQRALSSTVSSASIGGVNLLDGSQSSPVSFVGSFTRDSGGGIVPNTSNLNVSSVGGLQLAGAGGLFATQFGTFSSTGVGGTGGAGTGVDSYAVGSLLSLNLTGASSSDLATISTALSGFATQVTGMQTTVANRSSAVSVMQTYAQSLSDAISSGVGSLVDADMNAASTRLQALQTQQQLGIQALAIANSEGSLVLRLFGIT